MDIETIGVRDLKNNATRIVRAVREAHAEYVVTVHGEPAAVIRPFGPDDAERLRSAAIEQYLARMDAIAEEVGSAWASPNCGVELVEAQRRG